VTISTEADIPSSFRVKELTGAVWLIDSSLEGPTLRAIAWSKNNEKASCDFPASNL
jgi:hypothetical protein